MPLTAPPAQPSRSDPATFPDRADAFVQWLATTFYSEISALALAFGPGTPYCTVGGTANALTLDTGLDLGALQAGQRFVFIPSVTNTGATTINPDGLGAVPAKTMTGVDLPAGYMRAGIPMSGLYNGANILVSRPAERVSNANGEGIRLEDGTLICWTIATSSTGAEISRPFPATFANTSALRIVLGVDSSSLQQLAPRFTNKTTTAVDVSVFNNTNTRVAAAVDVLAIGRWY